MIMHLHILLNFGGADGETAAVIAGQAFSQLGGWDVVQADLALDGGNL
jgi:hypothetical protein